MPMTRMRRAEITFGAGLLGVVLIAGVLGEGILRVREALRFDWAVLNTEIMYSDDVYGFARFAPNSRFENLSTNRFGLPGPDVDVPKSANTLRLAFLGDSVFLGATLDPQDRVPVQVAAQVARAFPRCSVDWINIAGPNYTFTSARVVLADVQSATQPDAFVLMLGGLSEVLRQVEDEVAPEPSYFRDRRTRMSKSILVQKLQRAYDAFAKTRGVEDVNLVARLDLDLFEQIFADKVESLSARIDGSPTVLIENRGRERDNATFESLTFARRGLLSKFNGLDVPGLFVLRDVMRTALDASADKNGWAYIDPLTGVPPTNQYFEGPVHLTSDGVRAVAPQIADAMARQIVAADLGLPCLDP